MFWFLSYLVVGVLTSAWVLSESTTASNDGEAFSAGALWPFYWLMAGTIALGDWLKKVKSNKK